jgi:hypothetical protein
MLRLMTVAPLILLLCACGARLSSFSDLQAIKGRAKAPSEEERKSTQPATTQTGSLNSVSSKATQSLGLIDLPVGAADKLGSNISGFSSQVLIIGSSENADVYYIHLQDGSRFRLDTSSKPIVGSHLT